MPRTALVPLAPKGPYPGVVNAGDLVFTLAAADVANLNQFAGPGKFLIIWQNSDAAPHNVTLTSVNDARGRKGDIGPYAVAAAAFGAFLFDTEGWLQGDGNFYVSADNALVKFAVFKLPF
jgi:hypothetical protein